MTTLTETITAAVHEALAAEMAPIHERLNAIDKKLRLITEDTTRVTIGDLDDVKDTLDFLIGQLEQADHERTLAESRADLRAARAAGRIA